MSQQEQAEQWRWLPPEEVGRREARKAAALRAVQGTPGTWTQQLRLFIDFHITIAGSPPDDDGSSEQDPTYHARQAQVQASSTRGCQEQPGSATTVDVRADC